MFQEQKIKEIARQIRRDIVTMIHAAGSGHPGGSLSAADLLATLYFTDQFRCDPSSPNWAERDRFILSKGHTAPVIYSVLARRGFFPPEELLTLRRFGSRLQGHPKKDATPGLDCSSGSLGQGLSIANGIAFALQRRGSDARVYCLMGDGELQEGQVWEAAMFAPQHGLDNICALVDYNNVQLDGRVDEIKEVQPLREKWEAFRWNVIETDGHDVSAIYSAYQAARACKGRPTVILAQCVKGKGVSYMENSAKWHGTAPNDEEYAQAMEELEVEA